MRKIKSWTAVLISIAAFETTLIGGEKITLYDGEMLGEWESIEFGGEGEVHVAFDGSLILENGNPFTAIVWSGDPEGLPKKNYEISLEAKKHYGDDFFCGLTFPVNDSHATFICGGWGGAIVGCSSIDGKDASLNETRKLMSFDDGRWYALRVRVTENHVSAWIDDKPVFKVELKGKAISLRAGPIEKCVPLGIANYRTRSGFRNIELRHLGSTLADEGK
ncbi:MAG: hypothetical protein CMO47_10825 [Verrucomicrobiales bacterium]|nr:hypothetical protein [Verrucomicrobiales bacterium]|tara:strand:- start:11557 stop:12216 length:660 start_codon:yes stop_codon:yes gene_type:complete